LVADDSAFMRAAIVRLLSSDARFEVVGQAKDGQEAVDLAKRLAPQVMTMDYNMPVLDGAAATRKILESGRVGIVMLSAHTREGAKETLAALSAGAVDFVTKPGGEVSTQLGDVKEELVDKLLIAANARILAGVVAPGLAAPAEAAPAARRAPRASATLPAGKKLAVIAASTGGPAALERVLSKLASANDLAIVVVQHMPAGYTSALAARLDELSAWTVREAADGEPVAVGVVLVAPGGKHLEIDRGGVVRLSDAAPLHGVRPAADVTLRSAAMAFGARLLGVVMTGMGRDGATGLAAVKSAGGITLAQNADTSTIYGMPKAAVDMGVVDQVVPLEGIAAAITKACGRG
jgi:two-component system, chemotaxis family, protein-glutamate methylesterase/glutaminase